MHWLTFSSFVCLWFTVYGRYVGTQQYTAFGYHQKIGIPKASALMVAESKRIVGGSPSSSISQHPHQVSFMSRYIHFIQLKIFKQY